MQNLKRLLHGAYMTVALYYIIYKVSLYSATSASGLSPRSPLSRLLNVM